MIDRVELDVVDEVLDVRDLEDGHAIVAQHGPEAAHEAFEIGDMGQHVVGVNDGGATPSGDERVREGRAEKRALRGDAARARAASAAMLRAGSTPSTGIPCATYHCKR